MGLEMKNQDLIELYQLAALYSSTYGSEKAAALLAEVKAHYWDKYKTDIAKERNPREAGRRKKYNEETDRMTRQMREQRRSIRSIAEETGCSVGYVQSIVKRRPGVQ